MPMRPLLGFGRNAWLLLLTSAGGAITVGVFGVVFNLYVVGLGFSTSVLGWVLGAGTAGLAVGVVPAGALADVWGRKRTLVLGGLLSGPPTAAQCLFASAPVLIGAGVLAGLGGAAIAVVALPMLLESVPERTRPALLSVGGAIAVLGSAAGSVLGGWLPGVLASPLGVAPAAALAYRLTLLLALALSAVTALPLLLWYRDQHAPRPWRRTLTGLRDPAWRRVAWRLCAVVGTVGLGAGFVIPYLNLYFTRVIGVSTATYGTLSATAQVILGLTTLLAGVLTVRFGVPIVVASTQGLAIVGLLVLATAPTATVAGGSYVARQALMDMTQPVAQGWLLGLVAPEQRALTSSLLLIAQQVPWAVTSTIGGSLQARAGFLPGFLLTAALYVVSSLLWVLLFQGKAGQEHHKAQQEGILEQSEY